MERPSSESGTLPLSLVRQVDEVCDDVEALLRQGLRPCIDDVLLRVPPLARAALMTELTKLLVDYLPANNQRTSMPGADTATTAAHITHNGAPVPLALGHAAVVRTISPISANTPANAVLGDYELLEQIGAGGMGAVYRAYQRSVRRTVAVKLLLPSKFANQPPEVRDRFLDRFRREARATARLHHECIVTIYDVGEVDGQPYYAMEYVDGPSLAELVRNGPFEERRAARYARDIARALHETHAAGVLHRDIKPSNILLEAKSDRVLLADFGLAKSAAESNVATVSGEFFGTPAYVAPEQVRDASRASAASDIYSLGATLFHLVVGAPPFTGESVAETLNQVLNSEPPPPRSINPAVSRDLATVCIKCLEKVSLRRYATASALADDLDRFLARLPVSARPINRLGYVRRWSQRNPIMSSLVALVMLLLIAGTSISMVLYLHQLRVSNRARELFAISQNELARLYLERAQSADSPGVAQLWLAEVLNLAALEEPIRSKARRSAEILSGECPLPDQCFFHPSAVDCAVFSPDGKQLLAGTATGDVFVWDRATLRLFSHTQPHKKAVLVAAYSDDARYFVTADAAGVAIVHCAEYTTSLDAPIGQQRPINVAHFNRRGDRLVIAGSSRSASLWSIPPASQPLAKLDHDDVVQAAEFSASGDRIATASADKTVRVWDASTGAPLGEPLTHTAEVESCQFSGDGTLLVTGTRAGDTCLWKYTGSEWQLETTYHHHAPIAAVGFDDRDGTALSASTDGRLSLWNLLDRTQELPPVVFDSKLSQVRQCQRASMLAAVVGGKSLYAWHSRGVGPLVGPLLHNAVINCVAFGNSSHELLSATRDGTVRVWRLGDHPGMTTTNLGKPVGAVARSSDRCSTAVLAGSRSIGLVDLTGNHETLATLPSPARALCFTHDDRKLLVGSRKGAQLLDRTPPATETLSSCNETVTAVACSPEGLYLAAGTADGQVMLWSAGTKELQGRTRFTREPIAGLRFHDGAGRLLVASGAEIALYSTADRLAQVVESQVLGSPVTAIAVSDAADRVFVGCANGHTQTYTRNLRRLFTLSHADLVSAIEISPDSQAVLTTSYDESARVWATRDGAPCGMPLLHGKRVLTGAFSADGAVVATAAADCTARLWHKTGDKPLVSLRLTAPVVHVSFNPDLGRWLCVSQDGLVVLRHWGPAAVPDLSRRNIAQLVSMHQLDASKSVVPLSKGDWERLWNLRASP